MAVANRLRECAYAHSCSSSLHKTLDERLAASIQGVVGQHIYRVSDRWRLDAMVNAYVRCLADQFLRIPA